MVVYAGTQPPPPHPLEFIVLRGSRVAGPLGKLTAPTGQIQP